MKKLLAFLREKPSIWVPILCALLLSISLLIAAGILAGEIHQLGVYVAHINRPWVEWS